MEIDGKKYGESPVESLYKKTYQCPWCEWQGNILAHYEHAKREHPKELMRRFVGNGSGLEEVKGETHQ